MRWLVTYPENGPSAARYDRWIRACGAAPVFVNAAYDPPTSRLEFDALLLPGGGDVAPERYAASERHPETSDVNAARDFQEDRLVHEFMARRCPVFGICRGVQMLNVALGGGLIQHVPAMVSEEEERHRQRDSRDATHDVHLLPGTSMATALACVCEVNSAHHQAADSKRIAPALQIAARSAMGVVEALESRDPQLRLSAVQWHPERLPLEHPASVALRNHWRSLLA